MTSVDTFRLGLEELINRHSKENESNTPDFILANYIIAALKAFDDSVNARSNWYANNRRVSNQTLLKAKIQPEMSSSLTNSDISRHYRDFEFHLCVNDIASAMQYWLNVQGKQMADKHLLYVAGLEYEKHLLKYHFNNNNSFRVFTYHQLEDLISLPNFTKVEALVNVNQRPEGEDFIDLGALARNVRYMVMRLQIVEPL